MTQEITTNSEQETLEFAREYASRLQKGEVIALFGDLGAGKTVFARGVAQGLGVSQNISSPTFVVMKIYSADSAGIKTFCHIDTYRINSSRELLDIGVEDYLKKEDTVVLIEWAEKVSDILPAGTKKIELEYLSSGQRKIKLI